MQIILSDFQDQLVKGLSHRMNNILTLFHGYLGLLLDNEKLDPVTQEGLAKIKDGARIATELMDRTNALVRPTHLAPREIALDEFLNQLAPSFETIRGQGSKIEIDCPADAAHVWADPSRVRIALLELIKNACEATEAGGGVRIVVSSSEAAPKDAFFTAGGLQPSHWTTIAVTDEGAGVRREIETQIYEPFSTTKKRQAIAGLGLTVAMGCMQQVGGAIEHDSLPGATTFRLILPARHGGEVRAVA
jgi:two-component system, cell cycle sensor histidine kinase and response regulator CckA